MSGDPGVLYGRQQGTADQLMDVGWQPAPELTLWVPASALRGTVFFSKLCYACHHKKKAKEW